MSARTWGLKDIMRNKRALICGVSGQDGSLLADFLVKKGYEVWGTSRDIEASNFLNLKRLGIFDSINLRSLVSTDFRNVFTILSQAEPDEIYFLGSQSSVSLSFQQPAETIESVVNGVLNFLEAIRILRLDAKFFNPSSSECFGNTAQLPADENTPFSPVSPYGVAKTAAHHLVSSYRRAYKIFGCNGILFNHESPLRPARFVTQKIIAAAHAIATGSQTHLRLGRLDIVRDWGWAPKFVEGMWLTLQHESADDYIFATGEPNSLETFVSTVFECYNLHWQNHVIQEEGLYRPSELNCIYGNPAKIKTVLGWEPEFRMSDVAKMMVKAYNENKNNIGLT
jgi:GDPmannose 4,6-dehydratase